MIGNECFQDLGSYLHANDEMTVVGIIFNGGLVEIASLELAYSLCSFLLPLFVRGQLPPCVGICYSGIVCVLILYAPLLLL